LSWNASTDDRTAVSGLTYNLRVGTTPGGSDIVSPQALTNGFRLVPAWGNAQLRTNAILNLPPGNYYWSVQAIDTLFAGGSFAPEASFVVAPALHIEQMNGNAMISWPTNLPGFRLQEASKLSPANWTDSPSNPTNPVVVPLTGTNKFYRLLYLPPS